MNYSCAGFALQYPNGDLVGLESGGGVYSAEGYPFRSTRFRDITIFPTQEDAEDCRRSHKEMNFRIVRITMKVILDPLE